MSAYMHCLPGPHTTYCWITYCLLLHHGILHDILLDHVLLTTTPRTTYCCISYYLLLDHLILATYCCITYYLLPTSGPLTTHYWTTYCCPDLSIHHVPRTTRPLLLSTYHVCLTVSDDHYLLLATCHLQFTICSLLLATYAVQGGSPTTPLLATYSSLLTIALLISTGSYPSLSATYYLLLTPLHYLLPQDRTPASPSSRLRPKNRTPRRTHLLAAGSR